MQGEELSAEYQNQAPQDAEGGHEEREEGPRDGQGRHLRGHDQRGVRVRTERQVAWSDQILRNAATSCRRCASNSSTSMAQQHHLLLRVCVSVDVQLLLLRLVLLLHLLRDGMHVHDGVRRDGGVVSEALVVAEEHALEDQEDARRRRGGAIGRGGRGSRGGGSHQLLVHLEFDGVNGRRCVAHMSEQRVLAQQEAQAEGVGGWDRPVR